MQSKITTEMKQKMHDKNIKQVDLAKKIDVSKEHLCNVLSNKYKLTIQMMRLINFHIDNWDGKY